jgi:hypothetical protein
MIKTLFARASSLARFAGHVVSRDFYVILNRRRFTRGSVPVLSRANPEKGAFWNNI